MTFAEGNVRYDANNKTWTCTLCNLTSNKYNWEQVIRHVNATQNDNNNTKKNRTELGMRVEQEDDIIVQMENDYGGIITEYELIEGSEEVERRVLKCTKMPLPKY